MKILIPILFFTIAAFSQDNEPTFFDPDGYYFPTRPIRVGDLVIATFGISSLSYFHKDTLDYDDPIFYEPTVTIEFRESSTLFPPIEPTKATVTRDTVHFQITISQDRVVEFSGKFLDRRGQFWNQSNVIAGKTEILRGTVRILVKGQTVYSNVHSFAYWEGD